MGIISINTNVDAINAGRFFNANIGNLSKANAQLASGRIDSDASEAPAAASVGASLNAAILAQTQAASNVTQASALVSLAAGSLSQIAQIVQTMKALTTQANTSSIGDSQRAMLDQEYQALLTQIDNTANIQWDGTALFAGGSGATTRLAAGTAINASAGAATADISSTFALSGFVSGTVEQINVQASGDNSGAVDLVIGGQTFRGTIPLQATGNFQLTSTADLASSITLSVTGTGLTTTRQISTELNQLFKLDVGAPLSVRSASTDLSATLTTITAGANTKPGLYGLSSQYNSINNVITYKITNGNDVLLKEFPAFPATSAALNENARTVTFDNGLTVTTAANTDETNPTVPGVQMFNVAAGSALSMSFQVGDQASNTINIDFNAANSQALGLGGTNISTIASATAAANLIDNAMTQVSNMNAKLGGTKTQLNFTGQSLALQIQNEQAAKATFTDTDITEALKSAQESTALVNMSSTIFQNTLQQPKKLAELVQTVMR